MKQNRMVGFAVIAAIYIIAVAIGIVLYIFLPDMHIFWRILICDIVATLFVYLVGVVLRNASVYDPYWSVAPIVIFTGIVMTIGDIGPGVALLLLAVWYWGVRLTCNWAYTFKNLATQDWRYDSFKRKFPRLYQLISLFGINLFPTTIVYLCLLPGIEFIQDSAFNAITVAGFLISVLAATLQLVADVQIHRFRRYNTGKKIIIRGGLWKHSRHPNYFAEILMWWGVYIMMLSSLPGMWFLGVGALANTLMFLFVSIPLADKRNLEERPGIDEDAIETNRLLPFKLKRSRTH